ncbi:restriction endonuclease [Halopseudomonas phragmitis]|uniref:Uncharacterized protein n=1 Tax=Halopseudomonas phragmitis TaxID=1931241 RepID=A0A1V0B6V7_9GAMM|nr:restriction endonuclease [Halopseudomonas phragmitis]AQZ95673.1 hypothetical protein BVH74_13345 [Halopseudomonas phragmitis]
MVSTSISKTLGPIHFEDLEPHRFEDLIRELAYDFRDWTNIEATGRLGADDGFDIRAFERNEHHHIHTASGDVDEEQPHPMEGRMWMFQCKREKAIGPKKLSEIVSSDVSGSDPPYGYILAAPANFSKKAYDKFREELRARGVMEFYLWGRAELEDMLHQPKNDRILFAFFGISLVARKRSRATELRSFISVKNKLQKLLGTNPAHKSVLLRDSKDQNYPYQDRYEDFEKRPRWVERAAVQMHPLGVVFEEGKYFAYIDRDAKTWDYTAAINLAKVRNNQDSDDHNLSQKVEAFYDSIQKCQQVKMVDLRWLKFESVVAIDSEGDVEYEMPQIYVDFDPEKGPFAGGQQLLEVNQHAVEYLDDYERVAIFPEEFTDPVFGIIHKEEQLNLPSEISEQICKYSAYHHALYDCDGHMDFLSVNDVVEIAGSSDRNSEPCLLKITHKRSELARKLLRKKNENLTIITQIERHIGRPLAARDTIQVYEYKRVYQWQLPERSDG